MAQMENLSYHANKVLDSLNVMKNLIVYMTDQFTQL